MQTRTSALKSLYVNTREVLPRIYAPLGREPVVDKNKTFTDYFRENEAVTLKDNERFYRPIGFTAALNQNIEVPREGLTTLELYNIKTDESVRTFDYYELSPQNMGFVLSLQLAKHVTDNSTPSPLESEVQIVIRDFGNIFVFGNRDQPVTVNGLPTNGSEWELRPDPLVNDLTVENMFKLDLNGTPTTPVFEGQQKTLQEIAVEHERNIIFRINRFLAGFKNESWRNIEYASTTQKRSESLDTTLRIFISQLRIVLSPNGMVMLCAYPLDEKTMPKQREIRFSAFASIHSGAGTTQFNTFGKYLNLRMRHEGDISVTQKLFFSYNRRNVITVGRCALRASEQSLVIQPTLTRRRNILRVVLMCSASSSNQYFVAQSSCNSIVQNDWTHTVGILACEDNSIRLIHTEKVNLAPGTHTDSIQLAIMNEYNDVIYTSNDFMFFFRLENDSSQHNPVV